MKKKWLIIIILLLLLLGIGFGFFYYQHAQKQKLEIEKADRIQEIKESLIFFVKKEALEEVTDPILSFYNELLKNVIAIENIDPSFSKKYLTIDNFTSKKIPEIKQLLEEEENRLIPLQETFNAFLEPLLSSKEDYEKQVYLDIYQTSSIVKKKEEYLNTVSSSIASLQQAKHFLEFLQENSKKYWIENGKIIYKTDAFEETFQSYASKFDLSIPLTKERDLGKKIPILMYHGVLDEGWGDQNLFVRVREFEQQMAYLKENGYTPLYVSEINTASQFEKPIIITFDDGYKDVYTNAYPILKKYGLKANAYVITNWLDGDTYMNPDMVLEISNHGFEIGSHTLTHAILASLSESNIEKQLLQSKQALETLLNKEVTSIAYPTGSYDSRVIEHVKKHYRYGLTVISDFEYEKNLHPYTLRRLKVNRGISISSFKNLLS